MQYSMSDAAREAWTTFRGTGLLWVVNQMLHLFGYAIVLIVNDDNGEIMDVYPQRVSFRGYPIESNDRGYRRVHHYLSENILDIERETHGDFEAYEELNGEQKEASEI